MKTETGHSEELMFEHLDGQLFARYCYPPYDQIPRWRINRDNDPTRVVPDTILISDYKKFALSNFALKNQRAALKTAGLAVTDIKLMQAIVYQGGTYGNFIRWYVSWVIGDIGLDERPWDRSTAHNYNRANTKFTLIHPVYPENKNDKLVDIIADLACDYKKIIFISPTNNTLMWYINNCVDKVFGGVKSWLVEYSEIAGIDLRQWNEDFINSEYWELREWLSFYIFEQSKIECRLSEINNILFDNVLSITIADLKFDFISTTTKITDFLNETQVRSNEEIKTLHTEWMELQQHHNKDELINSLVHAIAHNIVINFPKSLSLVDESQIQRILRDKHNIHIKCSGLNKWPENTIELKKLLYTMDENNEITL